MKSLYKKYNKERRLLKAALLVCFTFVVMAVATVLARGEPVQAVGGNSFKAFCWGTCDNFEKLIKNGSEPGVGKYSLYNPNFKYNNHSLYMENGNVIDLRKRCDGKVHEDDNNAPPCGDYCGTTKARYVEVLEFTHFVTMFEFDGGGHFRGNKHLITKINCSVVLDLGWGNTQEDLYTIEDRPKSGS